MRDRKSSTNKPLQDNTLLPIIGFVLTVHVLAWVWIACFDQTTPRPMPHPEARRLTVQTISLKPPAAARSAPPSIIAANIPSPTPEKPTEPSQAKAVPQPKETPQPPPPATPKTDPKKAAPTPPPVPAKPKTASAPAKKTPSPKPAAPSKTPQPKAAPPKPQPAKPAEQKRPPKPDPKITAEQAAKEASAKKQLEEQAAQARAAKERQQSLIAQAQERIAKIAPTHDKLTPSQTAASQELALPGVISSLKVDDISEGGSVQFGAREASYRDELAGRMKLLLRLPEYGDVKMKLTLDRTGKVVQLIISSAQSANNRTYIEKTVPTLTFPSFGGHFGNEAQHTFSITLSNDL